MSEKPPAVVGVGNILMGDDGVGPRTVDLLRSRGEGRRADLLDAGLAFGEVLCDLEPEAPLVVIDAVRGIGEPGSIYRLDASDIDVTTGSMARAVSLHELSVLPVLRMEALAGRKFRDVTIFGVEPQVVEWSETLSPVVVEAMERLADAIGSFLDERATREGQRSQGQ
ncbi:MAG TPA: hydrogenase maturation protease [Planctomycetota bacterium]|nr:hydrogenase maturation protease [Planctomycetota bacterium]